MQCLLLSHSDLACDDLQHKGCMPELDMEALYASLPSRNRELWALIRLTEAMAQTEGGSMAVCAQERGALAYQVIYCLPTSLYIVDATLSELDVHVFGICTQDSGLWQSWRLLASSALLVFAPQFQNMIWRPEAAPVMSGTQRIDTRGACLLQYGTEKLDRLKVW